MIFRSPCHCDRPLPRWTVPVHPATIYVFPRPIPGVPEAFQEQEWAPDFRQLWTVPGTPPAPWEKLAFWKGWRMVLCERSFQPPPPRADSASYGKGERGSFSGAEPCRDFASCECRQVTPARSCPHLGVLSPMEAGWSRSWKKVLKSHKRPKWETKNKTKSTEKVERLKDNRGGRSVVIYNRDCKMVN